MRKIDGADDRRSERIDHYGASYGNFASALYG